MINDAKKIAHISNDVVGKIEGFKVLGVIPFYLKYIRIPVMVELAIILDKIKELKGDSEVTIDDIFDSKLMSKTMPLMFEYVTVGLVNNTFLGKLFKPFIKRKVKECSAEQLRSLYIVIQNLSNYAFFFDMYKHMTIKTHVVLRED